MVLALSWTKVNVFFKVLLKSQFLVSCFLCISHLDDILSTQHHFMFFSFCFEFALLVEERFGRKLPSLLGALITSWLLNVILRDTSTGQLWSCLPVVVMLNHKKNFTQLIGFHCITCVYRPGPLLFFLGQEVHLSKIMIFLFSKLRIRKTLSKTTPRSRSTLSWLPGPMLFLMFRSKNKKNTIKIIWTCSSLCRTSNLQYAEEANWE